MINKKKIIIFLLIAALLFISLSIALSISSGKYKELSSIHGNPVANVNIKILPPQTNNSQNGKG